MSTGEVGQIEFPNDADGDALRRMAESGMELGREHNIDFWHVFSNRRQAEQMLERVREQGHRAEVCEREDATVDVQCIVRMTPTYDDIRRVESALGEIAVSCGGKSDGWGVWDKDEQADSADIGT